MKPGNKFFRMMIVASVAIFFATGCRSHRTKPVYEAEQSVEVETQPKELSLAELFDSITSNTGAYECVSVPVKFEIVKPAAVSFNGQAYIVRGKSVLFSLRKFGFEVAQLYITADSLLAVDKFGKRYLAESLSAITSKFRVSMAEIQNLLTGEPVALSVAGAKGEYAFTSQPERGRWLAVSPDIADGTQIGYVYAIDTNLPTAFVVKSNNTVFSLEYDDFEQNAGVETADKVAMSLTTDKLGVILQLNWNWTQAKWNQPQAVKSPTYPGVNYKKISATELLKTINL